MMQESSAELSLLADLLRIPSPPGREERMAAEIRDRIETAGFTPHSDAQGNVWTSIAGRDCSLKPIALAAHMDEIGMVVDAVEPDGRLQVSPSGGLHPWKLGECPVEILADGHDSVIGHLSFGSAHTADPGDPVYQFASGRRGIMWPDCHLFTGLTPDELARRGVRVGSSAVPLAAVRGPHVLGPEDDPLVSAWILDDRGGIVALLRLLEQMRDTGLVPARPVVCCFTVQEEGGLLGARGWAQRNPVQTFIAVDSSPIPRGCQLEVDGRPAAWSRDARVQFDQGLLAEMAAAARRAGTGLQYASYGAAASDASAVLESGLAPRALTVGYPRLNSHGYEVCRLSVFGHLTDMLRAFLERVN